MCVYLYLWIKTLMYMLRSFRALCVHLKREATGKFPDEYPRTIFASVGGFIFLRFICPAIVVPQKYGLLESLLFLICELYIGKLKILF